MAHSSSKSIFLAIALLVGCTKQEVPPLPVAALEHLIVVLGVAQDAGFPQAGCDKDCCLDAWKEPHNRKMVSSLAVLDLKSNRHWILDATPDFKHQSHLIANKWGTKLAGIFLTHAHIGHYTGLMQLGREVMGEDSIPVYAMPRMTNFLQQNGPWDQLVALGNIELRSLNSDSAVMVSDSISITPVLVPHRDEYSETVGYYVQGPTQKALFIPDIDKWEKWDRDLASEIKKVDWAFIDGSFYQTGELPGRDMSTIPHPMVTESIELLKELNTTDKTKVHFIHFNHTNPLLHANSAATINLQSQGFQLAKEGAVHPL